MKTLNLFLLFFFLFSINSYSLPNCWDEFDDVSYFHDCYAEVEGLRRGDTYSGEFQYGKYNGWGTHIWYHGDPDLVGRVRYVGAWKDSKRHGQGTYTTEGNDKWIGIWEYDNCPKCMFCHAGGCSKSPYD